MVLLAKSLGIRNNVGSMRRAPSVAGEIDASAQVESKKSITGDCGSEKFDMVALVKRWEEHKYFLSLMLARLGSRIRD